MRRTCSECKKCFVDRSVNYFECTENEITEEEIEKHFVNDEPDCPHFEEIDYDYD